RRGVDLRSPGDHQVARKACGDGQRLVDVGCRVHALVRPRRVPGQHDRRTPRQGPPDRLERGAPHQERVAHRDGLELRLLTGDTPWDVRPVPDDAVLRDRRDHDAALREPGHTEIGALISGCGSYPTTWMCSSSNWSIALTDLSRMRVGSGRGSRVSCSRAWSRWLRYRCASPKVCTKSPTSSPQICATMWVSSAYEAMLNGTPRNTSAERWYSWHESRPSE